ncbi:MAG: FtsH protease activity modulator HflK [Nitrospinota bacterium]
MFDSIRRNAQFGRGAGGFDNMPNIPNINDFKMPPITPYYVGMFIAALFAIWMASGIYKVELQEQAVLLIFGKHLKTTGPGLGWIPPFPIGEAIKVNTEGIKRIEIGFRSNRDSISKADLLKESEMLTQGTNIITAQMTVQYIVSSPEDFIFSIADVERVLGDRDLKKTVKAVSESALRDIVGNTDVDSVLTFGKAIVQQSVHDLIQQTLDLYNSGISIQLVQLQDVAPPEPVAEAFRDVNNAGEDKDRKKSEAEGYRNAIIPEARGEAARIIAQAKGYRESKIDRAKGDAARFLLQLGEYRKAPNITKKRLQIEMMEEVLQNVDTIIIDPSVKNVLPLLNLESVKHKIKEVQ